MSEYVGLGAHAGKLSSITQFGVDCLLSERCSSHLSSAIISSFFPQVLIQTCIYSHQVCSPLVTYFIAITLIVSAQQLYFPLQFKPISTDQKSMWSIDDPRSAGSVQSQSATWLEK